jgi:hypothetical protein
VVDARGGRLAQDGDRRVGVRRPPLQLHRPEANAGRRVSCQLSGAARGRRHAGERRELAKTSTPGRDQADRTLA